MVGVRGRLIALEISAVFGVLTGEEAGPNW